MQSNDKNGKIQLGKGMNLLNFPFLQDSRSYATDIAHNSCMAMNYTAFGKE